MPTPQRTRVAPILAFAALLLAAPLQAQETHPTAKYAWATAYAIPKELTNIGEGYFSIVPGQDDRLYIGVSNHARGAYLVEFNPRYGPRSSPQTSPTPSTNGASPFRVAVDAHEAIGPRGVAPKGFASQAKIHTRNNVGLSGKIYCATKQGYPEKGETAQDYPGGHPIVYDPKTNTTKVYDIPVAHQGIISITPDESRGVAYLSTCADGRPTDSTHFLVLDLKTGQYRDLGDLQHMYAFIVVDYRGRAYHPIRDGQIARYDPSTQTLQRLNQSIDGAPPSPASGLAKPETNLINWDISPDRKTLYAVAMDVNQLYAYDLTAEGDTIPGRSLGPLINGARTTDCRCMVAGPTGEVWMALTADTIPRMVSYKPPGSNAPGNKPPGSNAPADNAPIDHGQLAIRNPDFTPLTDDAGKPLPFHHGIKKLDDGTTVPLYPMGGITQAHDGTVYVTTLVPYTLLKMEALPER